MLLRLLQCQILLLCAIAQAQKAFTGRIELRFLDDRHLALVCVYDEFLRQKMIEVDGIKLKNFSSEPYREDWSKRFHHTFSLSKIIEKYRPQISEQLQDYEKYSISGNRIVKAGYWLNSTRQSRVADMASGKLWPTSNADVAHFVFLSLETPLQVGQDCLLSMPSGEQIKIEYRGPDTLSYLYKFNQLGFSTQAARKYAYIGAWQGDAEELDISRHLGKSFQIRKADDQQVVFTGSVQERDKETCWDENGVKYTGEQVAELDLSEFNQPGEYYFQVDGIGRSRNFRIAADTTGEAFYLHCRGLYHKRCGIAKEAPFTAWSCGKCHQVTYQGNFPPDTRHYGKDGDKVPRSWGFFDQQGNSISVNHFSLIRMNAPKEPQVVPGLYGGWHDAADHDRRPTHFGVVNDLLSAWLLCPENFSDGQLNIPESGDGIPDLLNEVLWGMNMWLRAQREDGAVATWIEAGGHPQPEGYNPSEEQQPYYLSLATRNSSLEYAAHAAMLAIALKQAGQEKIAKTFQDSAEKAFAFAINPDNRIEREYRYHDSKQKPITIIYRDDPELAAEFYLKAGFNLFLLTENHDFLDRVEDDQRKFVPVIRAMSWKYAPNLFTELLLYGDKNPRLYKLADTCHKAVLFLADDYLRMLDENHSYRVPWYNGKHHYTSHMSWGNCHPLRRARVFIMAWKTSGKTHYRDAAHLANDWHNGGNPLGVSMTSGLGHTYPTHFLDLLSTVDGIDEYVPGITPFRHTFGIAQDNVRFVHGLFKKARLDHAYLGCKQSMLPKRLTQGQKLDEAQTRSALGHFWPIWRRYVNLESYSVAASEYTVNETISPAAAVAGCLLAPGWKPSEELKKRQPAKDVTKLPGFAPLP